LNRNWSVTAEYLYAGFSGFKASGTDLPGAGNASPLGGTAHLNEQMTRAGIIYRF
jgi:opacity protein-like surface antigen